MYKLRTSNHSAFYKIIRRTEDAGQRDQMNSKVWPVKAVLAVDVEISLWRFQSALNM